jgi:hypothetical protein
MTAVWFTVAAMVAVAFVIGGLAWPAWRQQRYAGRLTRARSSFHLRREWLEVQFLKIVSDSGMPRGLIWADCDFDDEVIFATDRHSGQLRAFVAVTIGFEADEDGDMDGNPNVGNLRAATAVFLFDGRQWITEGRAVFNLNPLETVERFQLELDLVD